MLAATYLIKDYLYSLSSATGFSIGLIGIAGGLVILLLGCKLKKIALGVIGLFSGYTLGTFLARRFVEEGTLLFSLTPIIAGAAAAVLMFAVFKLALYLAGLAAGAAVGFYLAAHLFNRPLTGLIIAVVLGLLIGSVALAAERPIFILLSSFLGYLVFRQGVYSVISTNESIVLEIISLALLLAGIVIQFLTGGKGSKTEKRPKNKPARTVKKEQNPAALQFPVQDDSVFSADETITEEMTQEDFSSDEFSSDDFLTDASESDDFSIDAEAEDLASEEFSADDSELDAFEPDDFQEDEFQVDDSEVDEFKIPD